MSEMFSGNWTVSVFQKDAAFSQRFVIEGSAGSDGVYAGELTTPPVSVSGPSWSIRFEWNNNAGSGWQPSDVRRTRAVYTLTNGLEVFLGADDNFPNVRDHDFNDVVVRCLNVDPPLNPWHPFTNPYDFTISKKGRAPDPTPPRDPNRDPPRIPPKDKPDRPNDPRQPPGTPKVKPD